MKLITCRVSSSLNPQESFDSETEIQTAFKFNLEECSILTVQYFSVSQILFIRLRQCQYLHGRGRLYVV